MPEILKKGRHENPDNALGLHARKKKHCKVTHLDVVISDITIILGLN
jgi:hypothetical protein